MPKYISKQLTGAVMFVVIDKLRYGLALVVLRQIVHLVRSFPNVIVFDFNLWADMSYETTIKLTKCCKSAI